MRRTHLMFVLLAIGLVVPTLTWSQGPGSGFRMKGVFGGDPDKAFDFFAAGKDVIVISELPADKQNMAKAMMTRYGVTEDRITRERFHELVSVMLAKTKGPGKGAPSGESTDGAPDGGAGFGKGKFGGNRDDRTEAFFRKLDANKDGLLSFDEIPENMRQYRETFDANHDGSIDLTEFKAFTSAVFPGRDPASSAPPSGDKEPAAPPANVETSKLPGDSHPVVYRSGKLPPGLPEWFVRLDKEGDWDGQVGLWEARNDKSVLDNFAKMDLNGDGLLTAEEVLRYYARFKKKTDESTAVASAQPAAAAPALPPFAFGFPAAPAPNQPAVAAPVVLPPQFQATAPVPGQDAGQAPPPRFGGGDSRGSPYGGGSGGMRRRGPGGGGGIPKQ